MMRCPWHGEVGASYTAAELSSGLSAAHVSEEAGLQADPQRAVSKKSAKPSTTTATAPCRLPSQPQSTAPICIGWQRLISGNRLHTEEVVTAPTDVLEKLHGQGVGTASHAGESAQVKA